MDSKQQIVKEINHIIDQKLGKDKYMATWNNKLRFFKYNPLKKEYYKVSNKERIKKMLSELNLTESELIAEARKISGSENKRPVKEAVKKPIKKAVKTDNRKIFSYQELIGTFDEREHTDNPDNALKIAQDHLKLHPEYYTMLQQMGLYKEGGTVNDYKFALKNLEDIERFIPKKQKSALIPLLKDDSEEHEFFREMIFELSERIRKMPHTYQTDGQGDKAIAYLHYFIGGTDFYITEKDIEKEQLQAFGLTVLNGDWEMSEMGYIPIEEIKDITKGILFCELDLYWTPKSIAEIKKGNFKEDEKIDKKSEKNSFKELTFAKFPKTNDTFKIIEFIESELKKNIPIEITKSKEYQDLFKRYLNSEITGNELYESALKIQIPVIESVNTDDIITGKYINQYLYNKAVEKLLTYKIDNFTQEEKDFISHFTGYGGLRKEAEKAGESYKDKFRYEFFTPESIAEIMVKLAKKHGYPSGGSVLEPSSGIGVFLKFFKPGTPITTYEVNPVQHLIAKILYPFANHINAAFETLFLGGAKGRSSIRGKIGELKKYDLVIGNPPYGTYGNVLAGYGEQEYSHAENYIDYFIFRGLDVTKSGGLLIFVVGAEPASGGKLFTEKGMYKTKELIKEKADLVDAIKLWQGAFARTEVMTEILVFRKK